MARGHLFTRTQPGGAFSLVNTNYMLGRIWYVNSAVAAGTTSGYGQSPDTALSTVANAWDNSVLAAGDLILVAAGHAETINGAAAWDCDTAGTILKGLGWGNIRPTITVGSASAATDIDIDAANITFDGGFIFDAGFADVTAVIDVNSDGFTIRKCTFLESTTNLNALIWILGAAAAASDRMVVEDCECFSVDALNTHFVSLPGTPDRCIIRNNFIHGFYETAAIGAAGVCTDIAVIGNFIQNTDTDADACINLVTACTGAVCYNSVGAALAGNATTNITGGGTVTMIENYSVDTGDRQGVLDPVAT